ncbi:MAG: hypothetical protein ACREK5_02765 [Gemmatimonadota bacterium]
MVLLLALGIAGVADLPVSRSLLAQEAPAQATTASFTQEQAMEPLAWLVGDWEGEGWIQRGPGPRMEFTQTEHVESAFGGRILLVEGLGRAKPSGGAETGPAAGSVVHEAYGVLSWDLEEGDYSFDTYLADEAGVDAEATLEDGILTWGFEAGGGQIRFRIQQTEQGEWHETGGFSPDGTTWHPFFEMTLHRAGEAPAPEGTQ